MDLQERERRLRQRFGPPVGAAPPPGRRLRAPRRLLAGAIALIVVLGAVAVFWEITPHDHVAPGCLWWTARTAGAVTAGSRGCVRGWYVTGGSIAEDATSASYGIPIAYANPDQPVRRNVCPWHSGDQVVARYHAVFDDGRTIAVIEDCR